MEAPMNYKELSADALIGQLTQGWQPSHSGAAQELVRRLSACLKATTEIKEIDENALFFLTDLGDIYLRDMNQVPCFVLGGEEIDAGTVREHCRKVTHRLAFILALSDGALEQIKDEFSHSSFLLLSAKEILQLLTATNASQLLRSALLEQISQNRLIPYNIFLPASGNMFFGRRGELGRLQSENHTGFAIAGPGRIGKTSLIKRYAAELTRTKDPMGPLTFLIDFIDCSDHSPDGVAKFFAKRIESTRWSDRMTAGQLMNFLRYQSNRLGGPLNLLFDEVDEVCQGEAFNCIAAAARDGYCRLVLCGRGNLLKVMLNSASALDRRLNLIQLEPLDERSAKELILRPLMHLGLQLENEDHIIDHVLRMTGRLPHLLQIYGHKLALLAIEEKTNTISLGLLETLKWDFAVAQYFINPFCDMKDPQLRTVGLSLLKSTGQTFSIPAVQEIAMQAGLKLDYITAREICNDLLINNVLVWNNGTFRIANEGLYFYAKEMGFLDNALKEAIDQLKAPS